MLANVFTKTVRDRWLGTAIGAGVLGLWLLMAMAVYRDLDLSLYTDLPEAIRGLMGISENADVASLAYGVVFGFAGAMTLAGLAVSQGAASIAGEERDGTIGILLGNPRSRTRVLLAKAGSMVMLIGVGSVLLWGAALLTPALLGVDISGMRVGSFVFHMFVNSLFYGFLAMVLGGWTGRRTTASGATVGVMLLSYFAVGLLPLIAGAADAARFFPWYYLDAGDPVINGIHWGHMGILGGGALLFAAAAVVGVNRRDLRGRETGTTLLDRLRTHPLTEKVVDRLAGSTRVSRIWIKTASEHQGLLIITGYVMFLVMGVLMGPMYLAIDDTLKSFAESFPEAMLAFIGDADMATPEGWFQTETFSLMGPVAVILVTVVIASRALAGEEAQRTMGLLLANPIRRSTVVLEKAGAMVLYAVATGFLTGAGVAVGSLIAGLGMSMGNIAATTVLMTLLGLVFGALSLLLSAATGRVRVAVYGTIGAALTLYLLDSLFPLSDTLDGFTRWMPFHYFLSSDPLNNGMNWLHAGVLAAIIAVLLVLAVVAFDRRDLRQTG